LSKGAIAVIIATVAGLVASIIVAVLVVTVRNKHSDVKPDLYGRLTVEDESSRVATPPYFSGDKVLVKYLPTPAGFSYKVKWSFSADRGGSWTDVTPTTPEGNSAVFTLPETTFSDSCLFKAESTVNSIEAVTTGPFSVIPTFSIMAGAGTEAHDKVYASSLKPITLTIKLDPILQNLNKVNDWSIVTSPHRGSFPSNTGEEVTAVSVDRANSTVQLTWTASEARTQVYYRVKTTSLPLSQYPRQLSAVSPFPIDILPYTPEDACGEAAKLCHVIMVDSSGKSNRFIAGTPVTLEFLHDGSFSGTAAWAYSVEGGTPETLVTTSGPAQPYQNTVAYQWLLPDGLFTDHLVLTVTSDEQSAASQAYSVKPGFTWDAPNPGHTVLVAETQSTVPNAPLVHWVTTTVTFDSLVAAAYTQWAVSLGSPSGTFVPLTHRIYSSSLVPDSSHQRALVWYLEPDDFKAVGMNAFVRFTAHTANQTKTVTVTSSEPIAFVLSNFAPVTAPVNVDSCQVDY
jgi:hypothetical protein